MNRGELIFKLLENCNSILDIGCANGYYTKLYAKKCKRVIGIDPNAELIEKAKKLNSEIEFIKANAEKLPFNDEYFDIVIISDVLEHVENEEKSLEEIFRVLKKGSKMIITVPNKGLFGFLDVDNYSWYVRQFPKIYKFFHKLKGRNAPKVREGYTNKHKHYSLNDLEKLLKKFKILSYERRGLITGDLGSNLELIFRWILNKETKFNRLKQLDYGFSLGRFSSSILIVAEKSK